MDVSSLVYKGIPPNLCCCGPALRMLPNGDWVVPFLTGGDGEPRPENHIALCRSRDGGRVWGPPETVLRFEDRACLFSELLVLEQGLLMFVATHRGDFSDWRVWTIESADHGASWSAPRPFAPLPRRAFVWNLCVTSWGEWVLPFQTYDTRKDPHPAPQQDGSFAEARNGSLSSADGGLTWTASNTVGPLAGWTENNVVELSDERLAMLIRADGTGRLYRSERRRGRDWSEPVPTDIPNPGSRFRLFPMKDGGIALLNNPNGATRHPNARPQADGHRNPLALWISEDDMQSWSFRRVLVDFPGMLAYPDGVLDEEGGVLHFAFDYNRHDIIYWGAELPPR